MTPAERAKILARIRKCLALAGSPEPHEAAAALRQAKSLMDKHGLTEDDVSLQDIRQLLTGASGSTSVAQWESILIHCVRTNFNVEIMFRAGDGGKVVSYRNAHGRQRVRLSRKRGHLVFIGPENRVQVAVYAYEALRRQLSRARKRHHTDTGLSGHALNTFALGWVVGVRDQMAALAAPFALDPQVATYVDRYFNHREPARERGALPRSQRELGAYHDGLTAARDAVLNPGVEGDGSSAPALQRKPGLLQ